MSRIAILVLELPGLHGLGLGLGGGLRTHFAQCGCQGGDEPVLPSVLETDRDGSPGKSTAQTSGGHGDIFIAGRQFKGFHPER